MDQNFLIILLTLIVGFSMTFFNSFFKAKGKNIATKEDLQEVTAIVERVKNEFITASEQLKSQLLYTNQMKIAFRNDLRQVVIETYLSYDKWTSLIYDHQHYCYDMDYDIPKIKQAELEMEKGYTDFQTNTSKFELFVPNAEYSQLLKDLNDMAIDFQHEVEQYFVAVIDILEQEKTNIKKTKSLNYSAQRDKLHFKTQEKMVREYENIAVQLKKLKSVCYSLLTEGNEVMSSFNLSQRN